MEFLFEDDLFEDSSDSDGVEKQEPKPMYVPKQCFYEWFKQSNVKNDSTLEDCSTFTYQADLHYFRRQYPDALDKYIQLLKCKICIENNPISRELLENIIRCCLKLSKFEDALLHLDPLFYVHGNNNDCSINLLACEVYKANGLSKKAALQAMIAVNVNQMHPKLWLNLFDMLQSMLDDHETSIELETENCMITDYLMFTLLMQAKFLVHESLRGHNDQKMKQYESMYDEIKKKVDLIVEKNPSVDKKSLKETVCPVINVHEGLQSNHHLGLDSFIWLWLKRNTEYVTVS